MCIRDRLGDTVVVSTWVDGQWSYEALNPDNAMSIDTLDLSVPAGDIVVALLGSNSIGGGAGLVVTTLPNRLASYTAALDTAQWTLDFAAEDVIHDLGSFEDGAILVRFSGEAVCAGGSLSCVRRVEPGGTTSWTVPVDNSATASTHADGSVVVIHRPSTGNGFLAETLAADGTPSERPNQLLDDEREYRDLAGVTSDGVGGFVLVGALVDGSDNQAVVSRYDGSLDSVWDQAQLTTLDAMALGVVVLDNAVFVSGLEDLESGGFGATNGQAFAAKLTL